MTDIYFMVVGIKAQQKIDEFKKQRDLFWKSTKKMCKQLGATGKCCTDAFSGKLKSLEFKEDPGKDWKKDKSADGFYMPKLSTKKGKELSKEFDEYICPAGAWLNEQFLSEFDFNLMGVEEINNKIILVCNEKQAKILKKNKDLSKLKKSEYYQMKGE